MFLELYIQIPCVLTLKDIHHKPKLIHVRTPFTTIRILKIGIINI